MPMGFLNSSWRILPGVGYGTLCVISVRCVMLLVVINDFNAEGPAVGETKGGSLLVVDKGTTHADLSRAAGVRRIK